MSSVAARSMYCEKADRVARVEEDGGTRLVAVVQPRSFDDSRDLSLLPYHDCRDLLTTEAKRVRLPSTSFSDDLGSVASSPFCTSSEGANA